MSSPGYYMLDLYYGDDATWQFVCWDDVAKTQATDLAGATADAQIRTRAGGTTLVTLTCAIEEPQTITVTMPASAWSTWTTQTRAAWDLQITWPDTTVTTIVAGDVTATLDVTQGA